LLTKFGQLKLALLIIFFERFLHDPCLTDLPTLVTPPILLEVPAPTVKNLNKNKER